MLNALPERFAVHTTKLTKAQAARAARVSHTTIWRAIKRGRLSAEQADDGTLRVDASELLRVFPHADLARAQERAPHRAMLNQERSELHALHTLVEELQADKRHLRAELDRAAEERARLVSVIERNTRLLEEQAEQVRLLTDARPVQKKRWWRWW